MFARHGLDAAAYQKAFEQFGKDGFALHSVSGYRDDGKVRYAAVWVKDNSATRGNHGVPSANYQKVYDDGVKDGFMPVLVQGFGAGKGHAFCAIFKKRPAAPWMARHDLSAADYQKVFNDETAKGMRPLSLSGYETGAGARFAVVMVKDGIPFIGRHNLTGKQYQAEFDDATKSGFRPSMVSGYLEGGAVRYAAIFIKDSGAGVSPYPVSGPAVAHLASLDAAMLKFMKERSIPAGTLAVSRNGKIVYSRGFGWSDEAMTQTISPDASMRIASLTKAFTAACIHKLVRDGKLKYDDKAFSILTGYVTAADKKKVDARVYDITIQHLLDHKGGWDSKGTKFDPMFSSIQISKDLGLSGPADPDATITWMLTHKMLDFAPGEREAYANFGYCILGRIIKKVSGKPSYVDYLRDEITLPVDAGTIRLAHTAKQQADEPHYFHPGTARSVFTPDKATNVPWPYGGFYIEAMDSHGGLLSNAPDLCKFLNRYWISGQPRKRGESAAWGFFGSLPGTWTYNGQRADGVVWAALFNQREDGKKYEDIQKEMDAAINGVKWP